MTEEIINADGSRNWQANILLDNVKRLEQENKELKKKIEILLGQLVINDGEDVTVQISQSQFDEYNNYRSALDTIQRMVLSAWKQGKYLDGGLYNDLTNEFAKINEVLK